MTFVPPVLSEVAIESIVTPASKPGVLGNQWLLALAARIGARLAAGRSGPFTIGKFVVFARHEDVRAVLERDLDFRIASINEARILEVNGAFVLGEDRGVTLAKERSALYRGLAAVPLQLVAAQVATLAEWHIAKADSGPFDVVRDYARPIATEAAVKLFGVEGSSREALMEVARAVFAHTFLNIGNDEVIRRRAITASVQMKDWIGREIDRRIDADETGQDLIGGMLALQPKDPDRDLIRRTVGGMLVGSIDTTVTCVAKIMTVIGEDADLAKAVVADLDRPDRLANWCWEALRRWPHNPILLRSPVNDVQFGATIIAAGSTVVLWTHAAMLDPSVFPDPARLRPDRPAQHYLHFGGGMHVCAGRAVNGFQIPILVGALLRRGIGKLGTMSWAGPFPDALPVELT